MALRILVLEVKAELDVVASRQRARQIAALCGLPSRDQVRVATAVSELARNLYNYTSGGRIEFAVEGETAPQLLVVKIEDDGPGIDNLDLILSGRYRSSTGMGLGIVGAKRLVDQFDIRSAKPGGTKIILKKFLPYEAGLLTSARIGEFGSQLAALSAQEDPVKAELQQQNKELLDTLAELKAKQDELLHMTRELEDTNRGVVALYAELDEKADHLRRADEMKSRFLSNMSHEFRTPLNSIRALGKLLIDRVDGDLSSEQEKQVKFILKSTESLSELVDDLLDLAKIEAGKIDVHPIRFDVADLFSALRGMLRPLLATSTLNLVFEEPCDGCVMYNDEGKISQILRNFISNAIKFTESGEVRVSATLIENERAIAFSVRDTGIGIAPEDQEMIFEEFGQVRNRLQHKVKGTGLGLPLCRKLASLLNGRVELASKPGEGSTFSAIIPLEFIPFEGDETLAQANPGVPAIEQADGRIPVLVVEDQQENHMLYEKFLQDTEFSPVPARSVWEAEQLWEKTNPAVVIMDILLGPDNTWRWLAQLKNHDQRKQIPVVIATNVEDKSKGYSLGASAYFTKPVFKEELLATLRELVSASGAPLKPGGIAVQASGTDNPRYAASASDLGK